MNKNIYEIFDEFESAKNDEQRSNVIGNNLSPTLVKVLEYTFHPGYRWKIKDLPTNYKPADIPPGMSYAGLGKELRKVYMFQEGHPTAESLSEDRRTELLLQLLENLEPREAEVVMGIMRKDQGVRGLNYKFVKKYFPNLLP
jgi:hypothetical protein